MSDNHDDKFAEDLPPYARKLSAYYDVEYCGKYFKNGKDWDVYALYVPVPDCIKDCRDLLLTGYPQFILITKESPIIYKHWHITDEDGEISDAIEEQREQLRKEGHKRRPDQYWI